MQIFRNIGLILAVMLACAHAAIAAPSCEPTSTIPAQNFPGAVKVPPTNNLLRTTGKAVDAEGQKIIIIGRVLDKGCLPVRDAVVILWQNSPTGRWLLAGSEELATPTPLFAGAGRTYTDSDGRFQFITAFPGPIRDQAPFVNVKVSGKGIPDLTTALFFSGDMRNDTDKKYNAFSQKARENTLIIMHEDEEGSLIGGIDLVIPARIPFRSF